ncbi:hypothetical protein [Streptosporangium sandarakinum]|uniref:hypothetical protein n=1 Tax=Streptosporangium sandarakinum TaxID=1260955 RepID=UPI0037202D85
MTTAIPAPEPSPDDVARGLAEIERYTAAHAPALPAVLTPAPLAEAEAVEEEGETRRVRELRARVAEAHRLVALQADEAPLLVDTSKVRKRRARVAEAARLYELAQDPDALAWSDARVRRTTTVMAMSAAVIALGVSSIGVQASVVKGLDLDGGSIGWWAAYGVEPILSLPLLAAVAVQAYAAMRGRPIDRTSPEGHKLFKAEALLLGLTLVLNCWPALRWSGFDLLPLIVHALGPLGAVTAIWLLPTLWKILSVLPAGRATAGATGRKYSGNASTAEDEHRARLHALIASEALPAAPSATAIRRALGCGTETATRLRDELSGGAG